MQINRKRNLFIILFSLLFFIYSPQLVKAEQVPEAEKTAVIIKSKNEGYSVSLPDYVMKSENTEVVKTDNFDIYVNKTKINDNYGILTFVFRANKLVESNSMILEVPNALPYEGIIDSSEINWANSVFMDSFTGATRNKDRIATFNVKRMLKYSTFQIGFVYKLEDENKVDFKLKEINEDEYTKLSESTEDEYSEETQKYIKSITESVQSTNIKSDSEKVKFTPLSEAKDKEENGDKDSYNQNKTEGEVVKESKYPWLVPGAIIGSILILLIVIYLARRYVKNR
jgi:hypothetical protein